MELSGVQFGLKSIERAATKLARPEVHLPLYYIDLKSHNLIA